ncbi:MAG: hypothetical protein WBC91_11050 [Phototrophicaceae bacterium]
MIFPTLDGKTVAGKARTVPQDLYGQYNVVLVAFTQYQQINVDSWLPYLDKLKQEHQALDVFELPTLDKQSMSLVGRKMLDFWMYQGITDNDVRDHTITLYINLPDFMRALNINDVSEIYVMLIDRHGTIYWQDTGAYAPEKYASLVEKVTTLVESAE